MHLNKSNKFINIICQ